MNVQVIAQVKSKKEELRYIGQPNTTVIEFELPYSEKSPFYKLSGGTNFELRTVNQEAADALVIGEFYEFNISPSSKEAYDALLK